MNESARIYLDDSKLFDLFEVEPDEEQEEKSLSINYSAVDWYEKYFEKMINHYTFQLRVSDGYSYYVFSTVDKEGWVETAKTRMQIQATRYLDKINMEPITLQSIFSIRDVSEQVRYQYEEQKKVIFDSFVLVEEIMKYEDTPFVQEMIKYVLDSRKYDESKRQFWRIINEKYYGLDIHPLMEYEEDELLKILYYCENPEEQKILKWKPILKNGAIGVGSAIAGWATYIYLFS